MELIDRQAAIDEIDNYEVNAPDYMQGWAVKLIEAIKGDIRGLISELPSAQPNLSEAYSKAVFTWLMDYQIRAAELKGRYTPYEVLSWVINDWRKENG